MGTRPYQQIPFQFSLHVLSKAGRLSERAFLDLTGDDPSEPFARSLIEVCGEHGPIYVYNAGFETARIRDLATRFPELALPLSAISHRVVDLLPIARDRYYHPSQHGSWSIKAVLPAAVPELRYDDLVGVKDGEAAMAAYAEAIAAGTTVARRAELQDELRAYCRLDTLAMVRLWQFFSGHCELKWEENR
jgi:hypothetical protein